MADSSWDNGGHGVPAKPACPLWGKVAAGLRHRLPGGPRHLRGRRRLRGEQGQEGSRRLQAPDHGLRPRECARTGRISAPWSTSSARPKAAGSLRRQSRPGEDLAHGSRLSLRPRPWQKDLARHARAHAGADGASGTPASTMIWAARSRWAGARSRAVPSMSPSKATRKSGDKGPRRVLKWMSAKSRDGTFRRAATGLPSRLAVPH